MRATRWRCLTCGLGWAKDEPPETCPACGAPRSQFARPGAGTLRFVQDVWETFRVHPVAAHVPNGVLPAAVLFLYLALLTGRSEFDAAAFLLLILTLAVVPVSFASGIYDWKHLYAGRSVPCSSGRSR